MKNYFYLMLTVVLGIAGCSSQGRKGKTVVPSFGFDDKGLRVVTMLASDSNQTMSILYRNPAGKMYTLVTWKKIGNEFWYGSTINGALEKIETVTILPGNAGIEYAVLPASDTLSEQERIDYILRLKPSVFP